MSHDVSELPHPPRATHWSYYAVLALLVVPVWSAVPFAWLFAGYSLCNGTWVYYGPLGRALTFLSCCEVVFSIYHILLAQRVSGPSLHGLGDPDEIQVAYLRLLKAGLANLPDDGGDIETLLVDRPGSPAETITQLERHDHRAIDFRHALRTWFLKVPWSSIRLREVEKWLYWAMYNGDLPSGDDIPAIHRKALDEAVSLLQKRVGCAIGEGTNPNVVPMRLTIDRTNIQWRPLTFYALVFSINWALKYLYVSQWNLQYACSDGLEYLLRIPPQWNSASTPRPVVFIHGLGLGLLQYHTVVTHLLKTFPDRPILIPLQPQISQNFFHPDFLEPPTRHQMADRIAALLQRLGWVSLDAEENPDSEEEKEVASSLIGASQKGVTVVSHSNGTYIHAWILKGYPDIVSRSCFVDPVTFCSWEGDVCYNFFYRPCMTGMELLMRYFVGTELGVVNLLQRRFCWTSNSLWFEEIPNAKDPHKTLFLLGGKDAIVNSERIKKYLTSHGIRKNLWYDPEGRHGQALMTGGKGLKEIIGWLSENEEELR